MYITIINDCSDDNVMTRQTTRAISLFNAPTSVVRVANDIEAAGNIIDILDAAEDRKGIILANVAPRSGASQKKWPNGTPFGWFKYKNTFIGSTIDGLTLSLVKKYNLTNVVHVFDIPTVIAYASEKGLLTEEYHKSIPKSQFRSFDFLPRVMHWIYEGHEIPVEDHPIADFPDAPNTVWWVDNFGNCKLTFTPEEINHTHGTEVETEFGKIMAYTSLKDVPDRQPGLTIGSSGLDSRRFVELVVQGASAAEKFNIHTGMKILPGDEDTHVLKVQLD